MLMKRLLLTLSLPLAWFACAALWWAPHQFAEVFISSQQNSILAIGVIEYEIVGDT